MTSVVHGGPGGVRAVFKRRTKLPRSIDDLELLVDGGPVAWSKRQPDDRLGTVLWDLADDPRRFDRRVVTAVMREASGRLQGIWRPPDAM